MEMTNDIIITVDEILAFDNDSITDAETIRQIALVCLQTTTPQDKIRELSGKINPGFHVHGLYPHAMEIF